MIEVSEWARLPLVAGHVTSQNEVLRASHTGQTWRITGWKEPWETAAFFAWKEARSWDVFAEFTGQPCDVSMDLGFREKRKRDPHNYIGTVMKWVIDGLVLGGLWPDDSPEWVTTHEPILTVHKGLPKTAALPCAVLLHLRESNA